MPEQGLDQLFSRKQKLEEFMEHPIYRELDEALQNVIRSRRSAEFSVELSSLDAAFKLAGARGEVSGLMLARGWPQLMLDDVKADIARRLEEERNEKDGNISGDTTTNDI